MQPSPAQSETARINGAKSNGPVTAEGKAVSSQNSLKHGLTAKKAVLPGEDQAEFDCHRADYMKTFQPRTQVERDLIETMVSARWRLNRLMKIEAELLASAEDPKDVLKSLSLLSRYENQLNRSYDKAFQYLRVIKENLRTISLPSPVRNEPKPVSQMDAEAQAEIQRIVHARLPNGK